MTMPTMMPGEDDYTEVTPIETPPVDGSVKLNELLSVVSLLAILWRFFSEEE